MSENKGKETKSFKDLQELVLKKGLCRRCGGCVSFCSAGKLHALRVGENGEPEFADEERCLECGICCMICPNIDVLKSEMEASYGGDSPEGRYSRVVSARSTDWNIRAAATDGGVVTALLLSLLERKQIKGALVSRRTGRFTGKPVIATSPGELIGSAGSRFSYSQHIEELGDRYHTPSPFMSYIRGFEMLGPTNMAVVGTPCQVHTIRKMQILKIVPSDSIRYVIGLFCIEDFDFDDLFSDKRFTKFIDFSIDEVEKINIKDDLIIKPKNSEAVHVPLEMVEKIARPYCLRCTEFANNHADISVGGVGSPSGYTTTIVRTKEGEEIYRQAVLGGYLEELQYDYEEEQKSLRGRILEKIVNLTHWKEERASRATAK